MKKIGFLVIGCLTVCLLLTGCSNKTDSKKESSKNAESANQSTEDISSSEFDEDSTDASEKHPSAGQSNGGDSSDIADNNNGNGAGNDTDDEFGDTADDENRTVALKEPKLDWWEIYNPNGFNTLTAAITNLNKEAIDVSYDVVYYKDSKEVARSEHITNIGVMPGKQDVTWSDYNIPESSDVEEVKLENMKVSKTSHTPITGKYEHVGKEDGKELFDFTFDKKPTLATITFLLYNDKNKNQQFDKGEIVTTCVTSLTEQTGRVYFEPAGYDYTDYEVFFNAT